MLHLDIKIMQWKKIKQNDGSTDFFYKCRLNKQEKNLRIKNEGQNQK